jgi:hypothetical protein
MLPDLNEVKPQLPGEIQLGRQEPKANNAPKDLHLVAKEAKFFRGAGTWRCLPGGGFGTGIRPRR